MQNYAPDGVDPTELLEMAVNALGDFDWEAIFKPDLIDDCDGFDKDYLGEEEEEEVEKTEEELAAEEDLWDGEEIEDEDPDIDFDDKRFRRKNRLLTILLCEYGRKPLVTLLLNSYVPFCLLKDKKVFLGFLDQKMMSKTQTSPGQRRMF